MQFRFLVIVFLLIGLSIFSCAETDKMKLELVSSRDLRTGETTYYGIPASSEKTYRVKENYDAPPKPKVDFRKGLIKRIVKDKIIKLPIGERQIGQEITYTREILFSENIAGGGGVSFIGHVESSYAKAFGHAFNQGVTSIDNTVVKASECKKYRIIVTHYIKKGTVDLDGEKFPFEIIEDADLVVYPDPTCKKR